MTYAPPYAAPVETTDPTNVMGRRIVAYLIDVVIPTVIAVIVFFSIWLNGAQQVSGAPSNYCANVAHPGHACFQSGSTVYLPTNSQTGVAVLVGGLIWLVAVLNLFVLQGITGATVGKYIFGLRVVRGDGRIAGFGWVLLRSFLLIVDTMCFALVGLITASVTHPHRRVGDMAAGTYVVRKDSVGRPVVPQAAYAATAYPGAYAPPPNTGTYAPPPTTAAPWTPPPTNAPAQDPNAAGWAAPDDATTQPPAAAAAPTASPAPAPAPAPAPTPPAVAAPPPPVLDPTEPHWDAARNAWVAWEPTRGQWMQFDAATNEWRAM